MDISANGKSIAELATAYITARQLNFFNQEQIENLFLEAVNEAYGYGDIVNGRKLDYIDECPQIINHATRITIETVLSESQWAVIKPLAQLLVDLETARLQEATKNHGLEPFGRSTAEIENDINMYRAELPKKMFASPIVTI
jgi:hypothetical protein